jgi:hypothetical protein
MLPKSKETSFVFKKIVYCFISLVICCRSFLKQCFIFFAIFWNQEIFGTNYQYQSVEALALLLGMSFHFFLIAEYSMVWVVLKVA